jgi:hypothetical protein
MTNEKLHEKARGALDTAQHWHSWKLVSAIHELRAAVYEVGAHLGEYLDSLLEAQPS